MVEQNKSESFENADNQQDCSASTTAGTESADREEGNLKQTTSDRAEESAENQSEGKVLSANGEQTYTPEELRKRKRKNRWFAILSVAIIVCVMSTFAQLSHTLQDGDVATFGEMLENMDWRFLWIAIGMFVIGFFIDALKYTLLNKSNGYNLGFHRDMKVALTGKYYECITPTATGGQPMQIYYLHKRGMSGTSSAAVTLVKYGVQMFAWSLFAAIVMGGLSGSLAMIEDVSARLTVQICGWIGFSINAMIPITVTVTIFCPRAVSWVANLGIRILCKLHIFRNAEKKQQKVQKWLDDFSVLSQFIFKHPMWFFVLFLLCLAEPIIQMTVPYLLLISLCGEYVVPGWELYLTVVGLAMYTTDAAVFIPTPGNSGAIEWVFMLSFSAIAPKVLFWYVLIWRFILYYSYILLGIGMNIFDVGRNFFRKYSKKNALPSEPKNE